MKTKRIRIVNKEDISNLVKMAENEKSNTIFIRRGRYTIDASSIMGVMSIDLSDSVLIEYPEDATVFEEFISQFEV